MALVLSSDKSGTWEIGDLLTPLSGRSIRRLTVIAVPLSADAADGADFDTVALLYPTNQSMGARIDHNVARIDVPSTTTVLVQGTKLNVTVKKLTRVLATVETIPAP